MSNLPSGRTGRKGFLWCQSRLPKATKQSGARFGANSHSGKWNINTIEHANDRKGQSSPGKIRGLNEDHTEAQYLAHQDQGGKVLHQICAKFHQNKATRKPALERAQRRKTPSLLCSLRWRLDYNLTVTWRLRDDE